ncbi:BTB/POZ domain-containing protein 2-like [Mercenaria mercenaria]|uniref:BTB/POZ domain-containing protein 2-like n=1 Tax=Mercenaria mercenaria TaxID=6596 RepID=UPI00234E4591|nr:BTB/POZ domain-containing protein 2-like [Mercenaria mercenaria]
MATKSSFDGSSGNWRETKTAEQCLSHLCLSKYLSDISFVFKGKKDVKLPAHKFVLSMRSDVFEAMFYGSLAEGGNTISIEDIEPENMKEVLRFVYSDKPELNGTNVMQCLYAAKKYALTGLVNQCSSFLENNIETSNVCMIHEQAVFYDMKYLQETSFQYILENAPGAFSSEGFLQISHTTLLDLFKHDELSMDEVDVFKAALKWSKSNCDSKRLSPDAKNLREDLGEAVFAIRFPIMPIKDFAEVVTPTGVLTSEEQIMLYQFNATEGSSQIGKFTHRERSGSTAEDTIDITQYSYSLHQRSQNDRYVLQIQGRPNNDYRYDYDDENFLPVSTKITPLKIKAITGTFVKNVETITVGNVPANFRTVGNKTIFKNPVEVSNGAKVQFHLKDPKRLKEIRGCSYHTNIQATVNGRMITIVKVPAGMETISFAKC